MRRKLVAGAVLAAPFVTVMAATPGTAAAPSGRTDDLDPTRKRLLNVDAAYPTGGVPVGVDLAAAVGGSEPLSRAAGVVGSPTPLSLPPRTLGPDDPTNGLEAR
jgi:hypothetical protein